MLVNECPAGLEPPVGARNRRKATENISKAATSDSSFDANFLFLCILWYLEMRQFGKGTLHPAYARSSDKLPQGLPIYSSNINKGMLGNLLSKNYIF